MRKQQSRHKPAGSDVAAVKTVAITRTTPLHRQSPSLAEPLAGGVAALGRFPAASRPGVRAPREVILTL